MDQPAHKINVQVAEHSTDTCIRNVILRDIQHDTDCDKTAPLTLQALHIFPS